LRYHFRNYPLTGHIADMAQTTRMTDAVEKVGSSIGASLSDMR
jgi:hypothetical protein